MIRNYIDVQIKQMQVYHKLPVSKVLIYRVIENNVAKLKGQSIRYKKNQKSHKKRTWGRKHYPEIPSDLIPIAFFSFFLMGFFKRTFLGNICFITGRLSRKNCCASRMCSKYPEVFLRRCTIPCSVDVMRMAFLHARQKLRASPAVVIVINVQHMWKYSINKLMWNDSFFIVLVLCII